MAFYLEFVQQKGLPLSFVDTLIRERLNRPLTGSVVLMGRQVVYLTPVGILALLHQHGITCAWRRRVGYRDRL
jgi:hypothetical protein